jgi:diguanylate cyclase (GGDEF)-like protein
LIRYYDAPASVKSFVGVPVFFSNLAMKEQINQPVAVVAIDSMVEDAFGNETLALLGQFTKLISALIKSYTDKYDLLVESELLRSIKRLQERMRGDCTLNSIVQTLSEETSKVLNWDFLSVVLYDESKHSWVAKKVVNRGPEAYLITEQAIDFPESIVGQTIRNNGYSLIDDLPMALSPRYFKGEKLEVKGSFVSVPISSANKCYGALNVESRTSYNFSRQNIDLLYRLTEQVATALEIIYMNDVIREYVIIDDLTGVYSKKFFMQKMGEELHRADDGGTELTMLFITADKSKETAERFGQEGFERVMVTLAKVIRASVRPYDIVGRYDDDRFGILLINTAANDAYLWAEKIRKNVAAHVMNLDGKSFSITTSTGLCGALEGMRKEELLGNTLTVLNNAFEAGGNTVRVF